MAGRRESFHSILLCNVMGTKVSKDEGTSFSICVSRVCHGLS